MSTTEQAFFDEVVGASGLSPVIARFTVTRLLLRAGVDDQGLTPAQLRAALGELESGLRVYLDEHATAAAMARLQTLAGAD